MVIKRKKPIPVTTPSSLVSGRSSLKPKVNVKASTRKVSNSTDETGLNDSDITEGISSNSARSDIRNVINTRTKGISKNTTAPERQTTQKRTQYVISTYHTLIRKLETAKRNNDNDNIIEIQRKIDEIGGLDSYQRASALAGGERDGKAACSKWVANKLTELRNTYRKNKGSSSNDDENLITNTNKALQHLSQARKVRLLDVGALDGLAYERHRTWIDPTYIDINPQATHVKKEDFFDRPIPEDNNNRFNVVALSLVVNFVPDPAKRGEMLLRAQKFLYKEGGYVFLVLPLPCVTNSRYLTESHLLEMTTAMGYKMVDNHSSARLVFYLFEYVNNEHIVKAQPPRFPKKILVDGPKHNNFCIVLDQSHDGDDSRT